jgi:hypothetical protein
MLGVNEDENPAEVGDGELVIAFNTYRRGRTRGTRPGFNRDPDIYTSAMTGPVTGITQYYRKNGSERDIVIVENGNVRKQTGSTLNGALTFASAGQWTFANFNDVLYGAGGTLDDDFWSWNGTGNISAIGPLVDLSSTAIYPSYVFQKWGRLWTAGFRYASGALATDLSSNPTTARYTPIGQPTSFPVGNTIGGSGAIAAFDAYGDSWVTGFGEYTDGTGDWLMVLLNDRIYAVSQTGDSLGPFAVSERGAIQNGCVHQNAFVHLGLDSGDSIYLSNRGIHSLKSSTEFGSRSESFLSWKIRQTFGTINQGAIKNSVGAYDPKLGIVIFFVPTGSNSYPDTGLVLDMKDKKNVTAENAEWDVWQLGSSGSNALITSMCSATNTSGKQLVYAGTSGGNVCQLDSAVNADLGSAYRVHMRTKHYDYGEQAYEKHNGDIWINMQPGGAQTPLFTQVFDYGTRTSSPRQLRMTNNGALLGTFVIGTDVLASTTASVLSKVYGIGAGQTIAYDFDHSAANEPYYIANIAPEVAILGEQAPGAGGR